MKITICGSMDFFDEMKTLVPKLKKLGFDQVFIPIDRRGDIKDAAKRKIKLNLINDHWHKILNSDCILVVNYKKDNTPGYVGGNTFLEMGFAFVTGKPIFMLNSIPEMSYESEMKGMKPIIIEDDVTRIGDHYNLG